MSFFVLSQRMRRVSASLPSGNDLLFQETFEKNPGYDNAWDFIYTDGYPDPDSTPPVGITDWGTQCLKLLESGYELSSNFTPVDKLYCSFEIYFTYGDIDWTIELYLRDAAFAYTMLNIIFELSIDAVHYRVRLFTVLGTSLLPSINYCLFNFNQKYKIEMFADRITGDWDFKVDGIDIGSGTNFSAEDSFSVVDINKWSYTIGSADYIDNIIIRKNRP